jgi:hypothetical protein
MSSWAAKDKRVDAQGNSGPFLFVMFFFGLAWPFFAVPVLIFVRRKVIARKLLFGVLSFVLCNAVIVIGARLPHLLGWDRGLGLFSFVFWGAEIVLGLYLMNLMARYFRMVESGNVAS